MNTKTITTIPTIQTDHLIINSLTANDIKPFYTHRTHPDILRYQGEFPRSEDDVKQLLEAQEKVPFGTVNQWFQFAIRLKPEYTFIGDIGLHLNSPFIPQVEIAYSIIPSFQRMGYASECVQAVINFCITQLQIKTVSATIDVRNIASGKLLKKLAFKRMAYRPHACFLRGEWCDEADYGLFSKK